MIGNQAAPAPAPLEPPRIGAKGSVIGVNPEHCRDLQRGFAVAQFEQIASERDQIAAAITGRKVGPGAGAEVNFEGAEPRIVARRIPRTYSEPSRRPPGSQRNTMS